MRSDIVPREGVDRERVDGAATMQPACESELLIRVGLVGTSPRPSALGPRLEPSAAAGYGQLGTGAATRPGCRTSGEKRGSDREQ